MNFGTNLRRSPRTKDTRTPYWRAGEPLGKAALGGALGIE